MQRTRLGLLERNFEKPVTNKSKEAVGNELEKNIMSESNCECSCNEGHKHNWNS